MKPTPELCRLALELAREAYDQDEIPVGSVLYRPVETEAPDVPPGTSGTPGVVSSAEEPPGSYEILASARNRIVEDTNATLHAEIQTISAACARVGSERLPGCFLVTTLEPCMMCTGALVLARIESVYFFTPVLSGVGLRELLAHSRDEHRFNHYPEAFHIQTHQAESAELLRSFFQKKRELHRARKLEELLAAQES